MKLYHDDGTNLCNHDLALILLDSQIPNAPISPIRLDGPPTAGSFHRRRLGRHRQDAQSLHAAAARRRRHRGGRSVEQLRRHSAQRVRRRRSGLLGRQRRPGAGQHHQRHHRHRLARRQRHAPGSQQSRRQLHRRQQHLHRRWSASRTSSCRRSPTPARSPGWKASPSPTPAPSATPAWWPPTASRCCAAAPATPPEAAPATAPARPAAPASTAPTTTTSAPWCACRTWPSRAGLQRRRQRRSGRCRRPVRDVLLGWALRRSLAACASRLAYHHGMKRWLAAGIVLLLIGAVVWRLNRVRRRSAPSATRPLLARGRLRHGRSFPCGCSRPPPRTTPRARRSKAGWRTRARAPWWPRRRSPSCTTARRSRSAAAATEIFAWRPTLGAISWRASPPADICRIQVRWARSSSRCGHERAFAISSCTWSRASNASGA